MTKLQIKKLANSIIKSDKWDIRHTKVLEIDSEKTTFEAFRIFYGDNYVSRTYWLNGTLKDEKNIKRQIIISLFYAEILIGKCELNKKDK